MFSCYCKAFSAALVVCADFARSVSLEVCEVFTSTSEAVLYGTVCCVARRSVHCMDS